MIILLYGPDNYRRNQKFKEIVEVYRRKNPTANVERFDLSESKSGSGNREDFLKLKEFTINRSIFADKKLAIVENAWGEERGSRQRQEKKKSSSTSSVKELKKFLESCLFASDLTVIILEERTPPAAFRFLLEKPAEHEEFEELTGQKLKLFAKKEAEKMGLALSEEAFDFLVNSFGPDTWSLMTELEKLRWFKPGVNLALADAKAAGDYSGTENLFAFTQNLGYRGHLPEKLNSLERLLFFGEEPAKIFNVFAAGRYLPPQTLQKAADYDVAVKSGKMDYEEVLLDLALS